MSYDLGKLTRSMHKRVVDRLRELLPDAEISPSEEDEIHIRLRELDGTVRISAMVAACHREDRSNWGPIAGSFCNLVVSRVNANFEPPLMDDDALSRVFPVVQPAMDAEDRLIREATPLPDLLVANKPWLDGLRVEFDYAGDSVRRRLFDRDLMLLGVQIEDVETKALANMRGVIGQLKIQPIANSKLRGRVLVIHGEGYAPAMLRSADGHAAMFAALEDHGQSGVTKILACAPLSDQVTFCNIRDKHAASVMVRRAWALFESDTTESVPLSSRLFTVAKDGEARYLDVGLGGDRMGDWALNDLGPCTLRAPDDWQVTEQAGRWVVWPGVEGPRVRVTIAASGNGSPQAATQLAERVRQKHAIEVDVGYGFFNGLPWAWVDTGFHDGFQTASMFVVLPGHLAILQTEIPEDAAQNHAVTLQKIIATISANPA